MGISYKENCPDIRNSQIFKIIRNLKINKNLVYVFDPQIITKNLQSISKKQKFKIYFEAKNKDIKFDILLYCLNHNKFKNFNIKKKLKTLIQKNGLIFDFTQRFNSHEVDSKI